MIIVTGGLVRTKNRPASLELLEMHMSVLSSWPKYTRVATRQAAKTQGGGDMDTNDSGSHRTRAVGAKAGRARGCSKQFGGRQGSVAVMGGSVADQVTLRTLRGAFSATRRPQRAGRIGCR